MRRPFCVFFIFHLIKANGFAFALKRVKLHIANFVMFGQACVLLFHKASSMKNIGYNTIGQQLLPTY